MNHAPVQSYAAGAATHGMHTGARAGGQHLHDPAFEQRTVLITWGSSLPSTKVECSLTAASLPLMNCMAEPSCSTAARTISASPLSLSAANCNAAPSHWQAVI